MPEAYRAVPAADTAPDGRSDEERRRRPAPATTGRATGRSGRPFRDTVIYEAHVRGLHRQPELGRAPRRGAAPTPGSSSKIPYLVDLGITAVELLPVFQFDALAAPPAGVNYWGYQPVSFFAPHAAYSSATGGAGGRSTSSATSSRRSTGPGIEVILDVVYNHTAEGGADGPTFGFRGLANDEYYILDGEPAGYADYSGSATRSTRTSRSSAG